MLLKTSLTAGAAAVPNVVRGEGTRLLLEDGRWVLDASNTAAPLGHAHPEVVAAVHSSADAPAVNEGWGWADRERAASDLSRNAFLDESWVGAVRFFVSASEANDAALSLAQVLTGRSALATRERAYHGGSGLAREMTVQPQWRGGLSEDDRGSAHQPPALATVHVIPSPERSNGDAPHPRSIRRLLSDSAAVLLDYSQGGTYHTPEYQDAVAAASKEAGCLWIADETVTGFGRVGGWMQFHRGTARPDMVTLGKSLSAGAGSAGALIVSKAIASELEGRTWQTYSSFRGHPIQIAAIRAHLRVSARDGIVDRACEHETYVRESLAALAERHPGVRSIDGRGLHWTVDLHGPDWRDWRGQEPEPLASKVAAAALERGVLIATSGERTSFFIAPPLIIAEEELGLVFEALDEALVVADRQTTPGVIS